MSKQKIEDCIRDSLQGYFQDLDGQPPHGMHDMLVQVMEKPLLEVVMQHAGNNQSRAAQWLGMNRNTLRKKLLEHGLTGASATDVIDATALSNSSDR